MAAAVPVLLAGADELEPDFMDERGELEGLARRFVRHPRGGQTAQFLVDERQQFLGGLGVTMPGAIENARHFAHATTHTTNRGRKTEAKRAGEGAPPARKEFEKTNRGLSTVATVATVATIAAAAAATAAAAAAAGRTIFTRPGDVHRQGASLKILVVEHFDGLVGFFGGGHFHEGEAAGFAGELVHHDVDGTDHTRRGEMILQVVVRRLIGKVSYEETRFIHNRCTLAA